MGTEEQVTGRALPPRPPGHGLVARLRGRRAGLHHTTWALSVVALTAVAFLTVDGDDATPFVAPMVVAGVWGAVGSGIGIALGDERRGPGRSGHPARRARQHRESRRARRRREQRRRPAPGGSRGLRPPWRTPWLPLYLAATVVGVGSALAFGGGSGVEDRGVIALLYPLALVLGGLIGLAAALVVLAYAITVVGVLGFGRIVLRGEVDGEPVSRALGVGPLLATTGLLLLPLVLAGPAAYDSPYRRDVGPLVGWVRDGVEITHPTLMLLARLATWVLLGGLLVGFVVHRTAVSRAGPARPADPPSA